MKKLKLFILAALSSFSVQSFAQGDLMNIKLSRPGDEGLLKVGLVTGSITVEGADINEVRIVSSLKKDTYTEEKRSNGMRRIAAGDNYEISAEERDNTVSVRAGNPNKKIQLKIMVPRNFNLKLSTVNSGDISVTNVTGNMELGNVNGDIYMKNVGGAAVTNTVNGDIIGTFKAVTNDSPMAFTTLNGDVDVTFPKNFSGDIKVQSQRGDMYTDFDMDMSLSSPEVKRTEINGVQKFHKGGWTRGKIGNGGSEIMMKTMNGDILIRKAK
ncbi:DUF4097 family beta strand repeat-containing protein [Jiulongibacter sp. NS-SX5]|uniref:DUF4097 family beta strand repeat-containing protein n=1 Tax=Jiulongibacter sp. NS-SX5 TaxID=3463854 RepID=UPI0040595BB4